MDINPAQISQLGQKILERFICYARMETTSDRSSPSRPTTQTQWQLARHLETELRALGLADITLDHNCFLSATLPGRRSACLGFMAHIDTSEDAPGSNVKPRVHASYDGRPIALEDGITLDPREFPELGRYQGQTVITSDGTTLLGADDKCGLAVIVSAFEFLKNQPDLSCPTLQLVFTPDEETGFGMDNFPYERFRPQVCFTMDGGDDGIYEAECFEAYQIRAEISGRVIHLGYARGKLVNAVSAAAELVAALPGAESPQATDGRYGYYCPLSISGSPEQAAVEILVRDFDLAGCRRRLDTIAAATHFLQAKYPGLRISLTEKKQYANMARFIGTGNGILAQLAGAIAATGVEPRQKIIRGGTDGARLSEHGIPCPNVFSGGFNFHSRQEWAALPAMVRACWTIINLAVRWEDNLKGGAGLDGHRHILGQSEGGQ